MQNGDFFRVISPQQTIFKIPLMRGAFGLQTFYLLSMDAVGDPEVHSEKEASQSLHHYH